MDRDRRLDTVSRLSEKVERVTPADVQRVARKYFDEDQSTTGWFVPVTGTQTRRAEPYQGTSTHGMCAF